jgi:plasmid stabilization system protein ParE
VSRQRIIRPTAQAEIDDQADYLAKHASDAVAYRFLTAVDETIAFLLETPGVGSRWISDHPRLQSVRRHRIKGFPNHSLFYRYHHASIEILHLYHGKQDIEGRLSEVDGTGSEP